MKQLPVLLLATGFLLACNAANDKGKDTATEPAVENHAEHAEPATGLALHNGVKWKADSTTVVNVAFLQKTITGANKESLDNYRQTAEGLQSGLNKMISECKMKGADHDALHLWLEPLLEKVKALKIADNLDNAGTISNQIEKQINLFPQYFE